MRGRPLPTAAGRAKFRRKSINTRRILPLPHGPQTLPRTGHAIGKRPTPSTRRTAMPTAALLRDKSPSTARRLACLLATMRPSPRAFSRAPDIAQVANKESAVGVILHKRATRVPVTAPLAPAEDKSVGNTTALIILATRKPLRAPQSAQNSTASGGLIIVTKEPARLERRRRPRVGNPKANNPRTPARPTGPIAALPRRLAPISPRSPLTLRTRPGMARARRPLVAKPQLLRGGKRPRLAPIRRMPTQVGGHAQLIVPRQPHVLPARRRVRPHRRLIWEPLCVPFSVHRYPIYDIKTHLYLLRATQALPTPASTQKT